MTYEELKSIVIPDLKEVLDMFQNKNPSELLLAIHLKDENQENIIPLLLKMINEYKITEKVFVFDPSIEGAQKIKSQSPNLGVGLSVGEKNYSDTVYVWEQIKNLDCFDIIWLDEWKEGLYNKESIDFIQKSNKPIYAISPELHLVHNHPFGKNINDIKKIWKILIDSKVDGICTDYPLELRNFYNELMGI